MERGEVWLARFQGERPVVLLSGGPGPQFRAVQVVAAATTSQKQGFVLMTGAQAVDVGERRRVITKAGSAIVAVGIEVVLGPDDGVAGGSVVRVALPKNGIIFCTWLLSVDDDHLIERLGVLSPGTQHELDVALALSGGE